MRQIHRQDRHEDVLHDPAMELERGVLADRSDRRQVRDCIRYFLGFTPGSISCRENLSGNALHHTKHALTVPAAAAGRCNAASCQLGRHPPGAHAGGLQLGQYRRKLPCSLDCLGAIRWRTTKTECLDRREPQRLPRQQPPFALEHFDEIVSHCPHSGNVLQIAADQKPHLALR